MSEALPTHWSVGLSSEKVNPVVISLQGPESRIAILMSVPEAELLAQTVLVMCERVRDVVKEGGAK